MIDDLMDEPEYDPAPDQICSECHRPTCGEQCGFCGNDLCPACFEMGGGFCSAKHTQDMIDAYEDEAYPPQNEQEKQERLRSRQARNELQQLGILPKP